MNKASKPVKRTLPEAMKAHCFKPGNKANPEGKNGWDTGVNWVKEKCKADSPEAYRELRVIADDPLTPVAIRKEIWQWILEQAGGKPTQSHEGANGEALIPPGMPGACIVVIE